jgi:PKD repeat protein
MMAVSLTAVSVMAQNHHKCGADIALKEQLKDPEVRARYEAFQEAALRYAADPRVAVSRNEDGVRIIPTVFHILHEGGNENITLQKVQKQLEVLNEDFRRLNEDTVNMPERFYGDTEYIHFVFTSDAIEDFVGDSSYALLYNRYDEEYAFHFNNGSGELSDSLVDDFQNVVEINVSANADTLELAEAFAASVNAQNGLLASFDRDTTFSSAPNFTVDGAEVSSLDYTTEHTFTTSWNGTDTDTTYSDTLMVVLYEDAQDPFLATDTLEVFDASVTYDVFDGSGNVTATNSFTAEGSLTLSYTEVPVAFGDYKVEVTTDGLGYTDDVLLAGLWHITSTIDQQGSYIPADCKVEFRLATKDPLGNCTDGVVRVFTSKTNGANNGTGFKAVSYWNAFSYLNVWSVKNIDFDTGQGTTLGYAQFPGTGLLSTDGITVRSDNIDESYFGGRTATHEVGHWLNLIHIWGDATCGSDNVLDTPTHFEPNFGVCGNDPVQDPNIGGGSQFHTTPYNETACVPDQPDGEMFMNYMDYSSDACMNLFTLGQKARMDFTFYGDGNEPGYRSYLISEENLEATGTADPYAPSDCAPISDFYFDQGSDFATQKMICVGEEVDFEESAYNGEVDDFAWTFEGGNPGTDTDDNPTVQYDNPGMFDVTLEVSNALGQNSKTIEEMVVVSSLQAQFQSDWGYVDSYWSEEDFLSDYLVFNQDGSENKWEWYYGPDGGSTGWESARMFNLDNQLGEIDELISPSYDLTSISSPTLQFRYSGAAVDATPNDQLRIMVSDDCGESWSTRETLSGFDLTNAGLSSESYRPEAGSTWDEIEVSLGSFANKPNVRVKFRWTSGQRSNNFYIDDLTISGSPIGMDDLERQIDLNIAPNPATESTAVTMALPESSNIRMEFIDILGKEVTPVFAQELSNGTHRMDIDLSGFTSGVYYLRIFVDNDMIVKKVVKN